MPAAAHACSGSAAPLSQSLFCPSSPWPLPAMQQEQGGSGPLVLLGAAVSKLLGRGIGACLASGTAPQQHTVVLELVQSLERPGLLGVRGELARGLQALC